MSVTQATDLLILRLQRREISSARTAALETAQLLYRFVGSAKYTSIEALLEMIRSVGRRLIEANPKELAVGNIIRKILKLIREEYRVALTSFLSSQTLLPAELSPRTLNGPGANSTRNEPEGTSGTNDAQVEQEVTSPEQEEGTERTRRGTQSPGNGSDSMPPTPGIHVPSNHFLSDDYLRKAGITFSQVQDRSEFVPRGGSGSTIGNRSTGQSVAQQAALQHALSTLSLSSAGTDSSFFDPTNPGLPGSTSPHRASSVTSTSSNTHPNSRPALQAHATLSNFVQMRHTRAQLERAGSTTSILGMGLGLDGILEGIGMALGGSGGVGVAGVQEGGQGESGQGQGKDGQRDLRQSHSRRTSFPGLHPIAGGKIPPGGNDTGPPSTSSPTRRTFPTSSSTPPTSATSSTSSSSQQQQQQQPLVPKLQRVQTQQQASDSFAKKAIQLKPVLVDAIREVVDEIETTHETCSKGAREHIHSSEIILTIGASRTVEAFLKAAWKDRNFTVFVTETAPSYQGHIMAKNLAKHGIHTIIVPDSAVYALMPRVTKVIFGAHCVLANGGVFGIAGALGVALAAQAHATPVVVVSGQYKFAPAWNLNHDFAAVDFKEPEGVLSYAEGDFLDHVEIANPFYDYVRPELINLFITNEGDHSPSYLYKIIKEAYDDEDLDL